MKFDFTFAPARRKGPRSVKMCHVCDVSVTLSVTLILLAIVTKCDASIALNYQPNSLDNSNNATLSFFFTADPQFGWGTYYSGNEERSSNEKKILPEKKSKSPNNIF